MKLYRQPARIAVDYHRPLPDYDPHWGVIVIGIIVVSWGCALAALHWALT